MTGQDRCLEGLALLCLVLQLSLPSCLCCLQSTVTVASLRSPGASAIAALALSAAIPSFRASKLNSRLRVHHLRAWKCGSRLPFHPPRSSSLSRSFSILEKISILSSFRPCICWRSSLILDVSSSRLDLFWVQSWRARWVDDHEAGNSKTVRIRWPAVERLLVLLQGLYLVLPHLADLLVHLPGTSKLRMAVLSSRYRFQPPSQRHPWPSGPSGPPAPWRARSSLPDGWGPVHL